MKYLNSHLVVLTTIGVVWEYQSTSKIKTTYKLLSILKIIKKTSFQLTPWVMCINLITRKIDNLFNKQIKAGKTTKH